MSALGHGAYAGATADMVAGLLAEFVGESQERAADLIRRIPKGEGLSELRRFIFDLAGQSRNFGLSMLETVADQAQNYLTKVETLDDQAIDGSESLIATIRGHRPGESVSITYLRDGKTQTAKATLGSDAESTNS